MIMHIYFPPPPEILPNTTTVTTTTFTSTTTTTTTPPCIADPWNDWTACSKTCGWGSSTRDRYVNCPSPPDPRGPPPSHQRRTCKLSECCTLGIWSDWTRCTAVCDQGLVTRVRPAHGAGCVPQPLQTKRCSAPRACRGCILRKRINHATNELLCNQTAHGESCHFECLPSFHPSGLLTCNDGEFSKVFCAKDQCPALRVENDAGLNLRCEGTDHGSWCQVRCHEGYYPEPGIIDCINGAWSKAPLCLPKSCGAAPIVQESAPGWRLTCANVKHGESCLLRCRKGFRPSGPLSCYLGQFNFIRCQPADCTPLHLMRRGERLSDVIATTGGNGSNKSLRPNESGFAAVVADSGAFLRRPLGTCIGGASSGSTCTYPCDGLSLRVAQLYCFRGAWSIVHSCTKSWEDEVPCSEPQVPLHAQSVDCRSLASGSTCSVTCSAGYELDPAFATVLLCSKGRWSQVSCVEARCTRQAALHHGDKRALRGCVGAPAGAECRLRCERGFVLSPFSTPRLVCTRGAWRIPPRSRAMRLGHLGCVQTLEDDGTNLV